MHKKIYIRKAGQSKCAPGLKEENFGLTKFSLYVEKMILIQEVVWWLEYCAVTMRLTGYC